MKKEVLILAREEKQENVERIARANLFAKAQIEMKIQQAAEKGKALKLEKAKLLETRFTIRRQAERQKKVLLDNVEKLKKEGKFTKEHMV